jgi:hypothetical protein
MRLPMELRVAHALQVVAEHRVVAPLRGQRGRGRLQDLPHRDQLDREPLLHQVDRNGRLADKVSLITGAGSGIGQAALPFAAEGSRVAVADGGVRGAN